MPRPSKSSGQPPVPPERTASAPPAGAEQSPLSLSRLRAAFAQMLGSETLAHTSPLAKTNAPIQPIRLPEPNPCEISPRTVVEAMLFVGRPDGQAFSAREMAAAMRGVSPAEIAAAVVELNHDYECDTAPYEIVGSIELGYKLSLRSGLRRMRDKLHGRTREAKLTPAAVEVLAIVAYNQPTTAEAINELRGSPSGPVLASLVRRKLVKLDRPTDRSEPIAYSTTDRFLRLFGLENAAALPRNEELEKI